MSVELSGNWEMFFPEEHTCIICMRTYVGSEGLTNVSWNACDKLGVLYPERTLSEAWCVLIEGHERCVHELSCGA